jgi:hypothetical protein
MLNSNNWERVSAEEAYKIIESGEYKRGSYENTINTWYCLEFDSAGNVVGNFAYLKDMDGQWYKRVVGGNSLFTDYVEGVGRVFRDEEE